MQAAVTRVARFHVSNEFGDWDRALHTLSFANAVRCGLMRSPARDLVRGVYDAATSVYLDRFLNVPPARLPSLNGQPPAPGSDLLKQLPDILDRRQRVDEAAGLVVEHRDGDGRDEELLAAVGGALLREDRNFHTIQAVEATMRHFDLSTRSDDATLALVAGARYLAAHAPTVRAQGQTFQIAQRLHRGEALYEETPALTQGGLSDRPYRNSTQPSFRPSVIPSAARNLELPSTGRRSEVSLLGPVAQAARWPRLRAAWEIAPATSAKRAPTPLRSWTAWRSRRASAPSRP